MIVAVGGVGSGPRRWVGAVAVVRVSFGEFASHSVAGVCPALLAKVRKLTGL